MKCETEGKREGDKNGFLGKSKRGLGSGRAKRSGKISVRFISGSAVLQRPQQQSPRGSTNLTWAHYSRRLSVSFLPLEKLRDSYNKHASIKARVTERKGKKV